MNSPHLQSVRRSILWLAAAGVLLYMGCGRALPPPPATGGGGSQATATNAGQGTEAELEQLAAKAVATAREINSLMAAMNQQAAASDTPNAAIDANQSRISSLEAAAQQIHDELLVSGRFDSTPKEAVSARHAANLSAEVDRALTLTREGVKARSFQRSVLTEAAFNLNSVLVVLRAGARQSGAATAEATTGPAQGSAATAPSIGGIASGGASAGDAIAENPSTGGAQASAPSAGVGPVNYDGPGSVTPTGLAVAADTPLTPGMLILVESTGGWYAADVLKVNADGTAKIHFRGWTDAWDESVSRERMQLVPMP